MERRNRPSARVVVVDRAGSVLLIRIDDPPSDSRPHWITPGGGVEVGERAVEAAIRELKEETGLVIGAEQLGDPIAVNRGNWQFRGIPLYSETWHFGLVTDRFELDISGWDDFEREFQTGWRWWSPDELEITEEAIIPEGLAGLARMLVKGERPETPVELPWSSGSQ